MPRPTTKIDLITTADEQFSKLWQLIDSMDDQKQQTAFAFSEEFLQKKKSALVTRSEFTRCIDSFI
ncbi:ClbS/DfsB family four-helix bundle protein [Enterococcus termitis]